MKKSDLEYGNVVETREGIKYLYHCKNSDKFLNLDYDGFLWIRNYRQDFTDIDGEVEFDIMKVYKDYTLTELLWERKEKPQPQLTENEKAILRNVPKEYKWIARDLSGMVYIFIERPEKGQFIWYGCGQPMIPFYNLFQFIQWEDEEPYSIEELLKGEEK